MGILSGSAWETIWNYRGIFINGFLNTVKIAVIALVIAMIIGFVLGTLGTGERKGLSAISRIYVEFYQNTPLILQVCFLYYAFAYTGRKVSVITIGIISLGLYHGAYIGEVVRTGILSIAEGQFDAARSQGFKPLEVMYYVILPQTVKIVLPPMVNQVVALIKNTSCLYIIGGTDLIASTYNFVTGAETGGAYVPAYILSGMLFFMICFPLSYMATRWEKKLKNREYEEALPKKAPALKETGIVLSLTGEGCK